MNTRRTLSGPRLAPFAISMLMLIGVFANNTTAHPLGNFSINTFSRVEVGTEKLKVHYVVDMAEIPTFQESQTIDKDKDGKLSNDELNDYLSRVVPQFAHSLLLTIDGKEVRLNDVSRNVTMPAGSGGLPTLRIVCDFEGALPAGVLANNSPRLSLKDENFNDRQGWRELVVGAVSGLTIFNSTAFGSALTPELQSYPEDMLSAPLAERTAQLSWTNGVVPQGATALLMRDGRAVQTTRDRFAALIAVPELTPLIVLFGLLLAVGFGALHAFSPGHGKTVVGAYLVGSRGTAKHAAFLGLTVTITHTLGVFALGLVTLFASQYVVPESIFPVLSLISGAIVLVIGLTLFTRRLLAYFGVASLVHSHDGGDHAHPHGHDHSHDGKDGHTHSHGGSTHTHLPPGADGGRVTWRSLLALGISGGLLPCPSALVLLLSAISLHRIGYGLVLVVAFSVGLAGTLTLVGLLFVYAGRLIKTPTRTSKLVQILPVASAFVIACVGAVICYEAFSQSNLWTIVASTRELVQANSENQSFASLGAFALLGLGLIFGLKHATEADHIVAVSTIVSEQRNIFRAGLVGGLWGIGHTISLLVVGAIVLVLRIAISTRVAGWLEFGIALMIIGLGINALVRALRHRNDVHVHQHSHDWTTHAHIHFHEEGEEHLEPVKPHSHRVSRIGVKPLLVGAAHGLAGSAALTLLVLTQIESVALGLLYLAIFGIGSVVGMLLMSSLVGLPFVLSARRLSGVSNGLQTAAGAVSIAFGLWYAYETGLAGMF
jgi:nickel/cobalt exporter